MAEVVNFSLAQCTGWLCNPCRLLSLAYRKFFPPS